MKKFLISALTAGTIICILVNWAAQETTIAGNKKQRVNFFGTLKTQECTTYEVENISIGRIYKQIPLYEAPCNTATDHMLKKDPRKGIISRIDLSETAEIRVPHPDVILSYQKKGFRRTEYIEIVVISNDQHKTKCSYLVDLRRKVYCDRVNKAGPIELEVPFQSIERLIIKGYRYREPEQKNKNTPMHKTLIM